MTTALVFVAGVTVMAPSPAAAAEGVSITTEAGVSSYVTSGRLIPVKVTVTAERTVQATVRLSASLQGPPMTVVERELSLVAGTTKSFWMLGVNAEQFVGSSDLTVSLVEDGAVSKAEVKVRTGDTVVGVLPRLADASRPPASVTLDGDLGVIRIGTVDIDQFTLGTAGLGVYSTIAGSAADIAGLPEAARTALFAWVDRGGRLLIDDDPGGNLPPTWVPGGAGFVMAGHGEIRATGGALTRGEWGDQVSPGPAVGQAQRFGFGIEFNGNSNPQQTLVRDAGLRLNRIGGVLIILGIYVVVVGPILFLVLRRAKRLTMAWVAIPALALVSTGLVVAAGDRTRQGQDAAHSTIVSVSPASAMADTLGLVVARSGGTQGLKLPNEWSMSDSDAGFWWGFQDGAATLKHTDSGSEMVRSLSSGQATTLRASGPVAPSPDSLQVEASSDDDGRVTGTVKNTGSADLADVAVFAGRQAVLVGTLAAGASAPFELTRVATDVGMFPIDQVWRDPNANQAFWRDGPAVAAPFPAEGEPVPATFAPPPVPQPSALADPASWAIWAASHDVGRAFGTVRVVGWRTAVAAPVTTLGGEPITAGRIAVTTLAPVTPLGRITDVSVRRELIDMADPGQDGEAPATLRFLLPPVDRPIKPLQITTPPGISRLEVWDGTAWTSLDMDQEVAPVPAIAVRGNAVLIRTAVSFQFGPGFMSLNSLTIGEAP